VEPERKPGTDADAFWRKLILPEEDRRRLHPDQKWRLSLVSITQRHSA
jgi:hypothetical protein